MMRPRRLITGRKAQLPLFGEQPAEPRRVVPVRLDALDPVLLYLPWPPSVNHVWRHRVVGRIAMVYVSAAGKKFRKQVIAILADVPRFRGPVAVDVTLYPPDNRARDIDNGLKVLLDALTHAGLWDDDSQVSELHVRREHCRTGGDVVVVVRQV